MLHPKIATRKEQDGPDRRIGYCEWFNSLARNNDVFAEMVLLSDEAQFKLNGTLNV